MLKEIIAELIALAIEKPGAHHKHLKRGLRITVKNTDQPGVLMFGLSRLDTFPAYQEWVTCGLALPPGYEPAPPISLEKSGRFWLYAELDQPKGELCLEQD